MATEITINPEPVQSFFSKIEERKILLSNIADIHKTLTSHFSTIDLALSRKSETLDARITSLRKDTLNSISELRKREDGIPEREISLAARVEELKAAAVADIQSPVTAGKLKEKKVPEMLKFYCRRMDASGLMKFLFQNRRDTAALRTDICTALKESVDPMRLVLDAAEHFVGMKVEGTVGMADRRRACAMLIQSVMPLKEGGGVVSRSLKERAAGVLEKWKDVLGDGDKNSGTRPNEASMFLQIVVGFGLKHEFKDDFLRKLVEQFASRRDMPKLAIALGFGDKIADIIDQLVKSGKEIEAAYFASEAGLTEQYPPASLLKASLKNCKRNARETSKKGNFSAAAVEKANNLELEATKAIMQCVEDLKLEHHLPMDGLKKRVDQLESARAGKRKSSSIPSSSKPSKKRSHGGDRGRGGPSSSSRPPKAARLSSSSASAYPRNAPRSHLGPPPLPRYPGAYSVYEGHIPPSYGPIYAEPRPQSPASYSKQYGYPTPEALQGPTHYGAVAHAQGSYGESLAQQYGYPPPDAAAGGAVRGAPHYVPQAPGTYGGSPAPPSTQQYGYSPPGVRVPATYEVPAPHGVPSEYTPYDYTAAAASYQSSYPTQ